MPSLRQAGARVANFGGARAHAVGSSLDDARPEALEISGALGSGIVFKMRKLRLSGMTTAAIWGFGS
jgi:hypothetical protein